MPDSATIRIAVLYSGEERSFPIIANGHRAMLNRARDAWQVDVFIHTWTEPSPAFLSALLPARVVIATHGASDDRHLLSPGTDNSDDDPPRAHGFGQMWRAIEAVSDVAKNHARHAGFEYDYFVRLRPDALWDWPAAVESLKPDCVAIFPSACQGGARFPSDISFVIRESGSSIFHLYSQLPAVRDAYREYGYRYLVPEYFLGWYLFRQRLRWQIAKQPVVILRETGVRWWFESTPSERAIHSGSWAGTYWGDGLGTASNRERWSQDIAEWTGRYSWDAQMGYRNFRLYRALGPAAYLIAIRREGRGANPSKYTRYQRAGVLLRSLPRGPLAIPGALKALAVSPVLTSQLAATLAIALVTRKIRRHRTATRFNMPGANKVRRYFVRSRT